MADAPNKALRWIVLFLGAALCGGVAIATFLNAGRQAASTEAAAQNHPTTEAGKTDSTKPDSSKPDAAKQDAPKLENPSAGSTPAAAPQPNPTAPNQAAPNQAGAVQPVTPPTPPTLAARAIGTASATAAGKLGGIDPKGDPNMKLEFSLNGAGLKTITLARYFTEIDQAVNVDVQSERFSALGRPIAPFGMLGVQIDGAYIDLVPTACWKETSPGSFEAVIFNTATQKDVAIVTRTYTLPAKSYTFTLHQTLRNVSGAPITARWFQLGPVEMPADKITYGGDKRRVRFGYLIDPASDPARQAVLANDSNLVLDHTHVVGPRGGQNQAALESQLWPNATADKRKFELVWTGVTNRYFTTIAMPIIDAAATTPVKNFTNVNSVDRLWILGSEPNAANPTHLDEYVPLRLNSPSRTVAAGSTGDFSMAIFAGPQSAKQIAADPVASVAGIDQIVLMNFGGMCGCCTFAWLTEPLLRLLIVLHDYITRDWALAIMLLVVIVRSLLHPVTKWSQIRVQRFGKQMQGIAPKMQQIKEKFADDPAKQQAETAKIWKEEGISPAGMLGCLPMFLQTPVWIALSAMLFFTIEIRHQGAFFGIFQKLGSPSGSFPFWFLGDLAEPDRLIYFHRTIINIPLMGEISSFNILPVFMGVLFYVQQKYMTPPQTTTMSPEQELQMKMMKWMTVFMFPLMMYNAPSGLTLYFFTNSVLGILESKWIKRHIDKHDLLNLDRMRAERQSRGGGTGWLAKLQERAEKARQMQEEAQRRAAKAGGPPPDRFGRKR